MIALYLLAAHLLGDFVFQTRWQAAGKFTDPVLRANHVAAYCIPFFPLVTWRYWSSPNPWQIPVFLFSLAALHFVTDSRRFTSTLGDWFGWYVSVKSQWQPRRSGGDNLPPNPWPPIALCIDQALHVCQLALLGGLFLR